MSSRLASDRLRLALVTLVTGGLLLCSARAQTPPATKAEAESSSTTQTKTNSNRLENGKNRLQQLEDSLTRALQPFLSKQSLEPDLPPPVVQPPPTVPVMQNTKVKEMLDRRKDWMSMTPEDIILGKDGENPLQLPEDMRDSRPRKGASAADRLRNNPNGASLLDPKKDRLDLSNDPLGINALSGQRGQPRQQDETELPAGIRNGMQSLRKMLATEPTAGASTLGGSGSFSDFFGQDNRSKSVADDMAYKAHMEEYRQLMESSGAKSAASALGSADAPGQAVSSGGLESFSRRSTMDAATPAGLSSLLHPGALDDANAKLLNQWNPLYEPPKLESPKPEPATMPMVTVPKRKF